MKTIELENLPKGAEVVGCIYDDPDMIYESGDVMCVMLPNGGRIDLGWDDYSEDDTPKYTFLIVIWVGHFGNAIRHVFIEDRHDAALAVAMFASEYAEYSTDDLIAVAVKNDSYTQKLYEASAEVSRLYNREIDYAFLCTMGGLALILALHVNSDFAQNVLMVVMAPCFVACHVYSLLLQLKVSHTNKTIIRNHEEETE